MSHLLFAFCLLFLGMAYLFQTHIEALAFFVASMIFAAATFVSVGIKNFEDAVTALWRLEQASRGIDMTPKPPFYDSSIAADILDDADRQPARPLRKTERSKPR